MAIPMPAHERFAPGTEWEVVKGPERWIGQRVVITDEVFEEADELWATAAVIGRPDEEFFACLSWLW